MYGKNDDVKHYRKVSAQILKINRRLEVNIVDGVFPVLSHKNSAGNKSGLIIRVLNPRDLVGEQTVKGWGFWVNPLDGNWAFRLAWIDAGVWDFREGVWSVGQDLWHWNHDEDLVHYRNFASTTARLFFRDGPLTTAEEEDSPI
jgi:hypothetical protein